MISFEDINLENWSKWKDKIISSESSFQESIRETEEDFLNVLKNQNYIFKIIKLNNNYIGNIVGCDANKVSFEFEEFLQNTSFLKEKTVHLGNIVIDINYRGKGYGSRLLKEFIIESKNKGYLKLVGFFRPNNSLPLIKKLGGIEKSTHKNWFDTREDYSFCELDLI